MPSLGYMAPRLDDRDKIDPTDYAMRIAGPERVALRDTFPLRQQNHIPCCVSAAVISAIEIYDQQRPPATMLSVLYNYYKARHGGTPRDIEMRSALSSRK